MIDVVWYPSYNIIIFFKFSDALICVIECASNNKCFEMICVLCEDLCGYLFKPEEFYLYKN